MKIFTKIIKKKQIFEFYIKYSVFKEYILVVIGFCFNNYGKATGGGNDELKADGGKSIKLLKLAKHGLF